MFDSDQPEQRVDDGDFADAEPACVALVPLVASTQWSQIPSQLLTRADPTFVTHLIATAEHVPQTCSLRRATPADAQIAYGARRSTIARPGATTRRTI